ncbi:arginyltransferase [Donghicola mangrovi]|uniref:Aspartate/glutamate leucyltransferase n=1 Tax=Donghicola mangrovi TaxID=2729614 RepID=A0A850QBR6_9RHOB|nr:arginyltransferase [Donghicola mangrovi]NVO23679.1 arginyltransferase [Donghicola mangrovi]
MRHTPPLTPQFYVTAPQGCPYLPNRMERKLFTALQGDSATGLNDALSQQGFRRSQNVLYRPSCSDCAGCLSARIRVSDFAPNKTQSKTLRRNNTLEREVRSPWATEEQFDLFRRYLEARHADGGMADMDIFEFAAMIEETPVKTRVIEYTDVATTDDPLTAVCLTDVLQDGLSMVYSFYKPELRNRSLGTFLILDHIRLAQEMDLPFVYLGYWVPGSPKMNYKAGFSGIELFRHGAWEPMTTPDEYSVDLHPLSTEPISEQVSNLILPNVRAVGR